MWIDSQESNIADEWLVFENSGHQPILIATKSTNEIDVRDDHLYGLFLQMAGEDDHANQDHP